MSLLALFLLLAAGSSDKTDYVVDWRTRVFPVKGAGEIDVDAPIGKVEIVAGQEGHVLARGTIHTVTKDPEAAKTASRASDIQAEQQNDKVIIKLSPQDPPRGSTTIELHVEVPPHAQVRVHGRNANIGVLQLAGPLDLKTKSGNIHVSLVGPATVHAQAARGKIDQTVGLSVTQQGKKMAAEGKIGGGGALVNLESASGMVTIRPATVQK